MRPGGIRRRWLTPAMLGVVVVAIAIAATIANVTLLGSVGEDRIGRLRPIDTSLATDAGATGGSPTTPAAQPGDDFGALPAAVDHDADGSSGRRAGRPDDDD